MEPADSQQWYLRKHEDGTIFGPMSLEQLSSWAWNAQIAPHDAISSDQATWIKAPMLPELGMDWLVEVTTERYYGPTTLGAVQEFIHLREIDGDTYIINACDGTRRQIRDLSQLQLPPEPSPEEELAAQAETAPPTEPPTTGISIDLHDRIRDLEQSLLEERRASEEMESRYFELQRRYDELEKKLGSLGEAKD